MSLSSPISKSGLQVLLPRRRQNSQARNLLLNQRSAKKFLTTIIRCVLLFKIPRHLYLTNAVQTAGEAICGGGKTFFEEEFDKESATRRMEGSLCCMDQGEQTWKTESWLIGTVTAVVLIRHFTFGHRI